MNVYIVTVTNVRSKITYVDSVWLEKDEEAAYDEQDILQGDLGEDYVVEVEEQELRSETGFNA